MFDYIAQSELDSVRKQKAQQKVVDLFFARHERVYVTGLPNQLIPMDREAIVVCEVNGRPGWYYVRDQATAELHMVLWSDMRRIRA